MNESEKKIVKRNLLASVLCLVLLLMMMLGTTLAWFTDNKGTVNTMVAGMISIEQTESFEQNTVILPRVPVTKTVTVKNDGNQDCYVRTLFAFEDAPYEDAQGIEQTVLGKLTTNSPEGVTIVIPGVTDNAAKVQFTVTENERVTTFTVGWCVCDTKLAVSSAFVPLNEVILNAEADNTWQAAVGEKYELIVLSQATQVSGMIDIADNNLGPAADALNTAFGEINHDNCVKWFGYVLKSHNDYADATVN